jgi:hypothetical protein
MDTLSSTIQTIGLGESCVRRYALSTEGRKGAGD